MDQEKVWGYRWGNTWPDWRSKWNVMASYRKGVEVNGNNLKFRLISDLEGSASVSLKYIGMGSINSRILNMSASWSSGKIEKVRTGDWNIYGCTFKEKLISVESMHIIRAEDMQWYGELLILFTVAWGLAKNGEYLDTVTELSGAQMGSYGSWQRTNIPDPCWRSRIQANGIIYWREFFWCSDNRYYRQNVIITANSTAMKEASAEVGFHAFTEILKSWKSCQELWADAL